MRMPAFLFIVIADLRPRDPVSVKSSSHCPPRPCFLGRLFPTRLYHPALAGAPPEEGNWNDLGGLFQTPLYRLRPVGVSINDDGEYRRITLILGVVLTGKAEGAPILGELESTPAVIPAQARLHGCRW